MNQMWTWVSVAILLGALIAVFRYATAAPWMRARDHEAIATACAREGYRVIDEHRHGPKSDLWLKLHLGIQLWDRVYDVEAVDASGVKAILLVHIPMQVEPKETVFADIIRVTRADTT